LNDVCPICLSIDGLPVTKSGNAANGFGDTFHDCPSCGLFIVDRCGKDDYLGPERNKTTAAARASLSHWVRQQPKTQNTIVVTEELIRAAVNRELPLPNPSQLATNILRYIGDHTADTGEPLETLAPDFRASVGAVNLRFAIGIVHELFEARLLKALFPPDAFWISAQDIELTLAGWNDYEAEKKGQISGNYGFIALETGDESLEPLIREHIKPSLANIGYDLVDYRDISKAGIIDNILRVQIRDAAFVLVDLTHDNRGAYWEAGYAEGLGKPVLYICNKSKFDERSTHFDTNHCTTVQWDVDNIPEFIANLTATLKRSLNI
jgi:hypothetical protein